MNFEFTRNVLPINHIYDDFSKGRLIIDTSYQRRRVWMIKDNVRLIETILLNLIIPEIFLWPADINPDTGQTITHIVDGQQRINAIIDFISGKFKLDGKYILKDNDNHGCINKYFSDLPPEIKRHIWDYKLSIVNIDRNCNIDEIKKMFKRLNLTNYSLNEQEKRNSLDSAFGDVSLGLSEDVFWEKHKVFSASDVKRMKDVEYCSNILILAREGIVDQTSSKKINEVYDDLKEMYDESEKDIKLISFTMDMIDQLTNDKTFSFISKKSHMYTMFSFCFNLIENEIEINDEMIEGFKLFVTAYNKFKNDMDLSFEDIDCAQVYDGIKKYKLASQEGVNKVGNRVIRFEILKKFCVDSNNSIMSSLIKVTEKIDNLYPNSECEIEQDEIED